MWYNRRLSPLTRTHWHITSAEFYGHGLTTANLDLLARFFKKYPGYADRTFLSVKGGSVPGKLVSDGSRKNLRRSVDAILKALRGTKRLDLFEPARLDWNYDIEHYGEVLNELVKEGKFDYIGLSAVGAETVRRAHKVRSIFYFFNHSPYTCECLYYEFRSCPSRQSRSK